MEQLNFATSAEDAVAIEKIALRYGMLAQGPRPVDVGDVWMDITACHCNGCPLKLDELLAATDEDLVHDVRGIVMHINRRTGKLSGSFLPRFHAEAVAV